MSPNTLVAAPAVMAEADNDRAAQPDWCSRIHFPIPTEATERWSELSPTHFRMFALTLAAWGQAAPPKPHLRQPGTAVAPGRIRDPKWKQRPVPSVKISASPAWVRDDVHPVMIEIDRNDGRQDKHDLQDGFDASPAKPSIQRLRDKPLHLLNRLIPVQRLVAGSTDLTMKSTTALAFMAYGCPALLFAFRAAGGGASSGATKPSPGWFHSRYGSCNRRCSASSNASISCNFAAWRGSRARLV